MILEEKIEELILYCGYEGMIKEVVYNKVFPEAFFKSSFFDILDEHNIDKAKNFLKKIKKENVVFNWELNIKYENRVTGYYFAGLRVKEKILILSTNSFSRLKKIYEEILRINVEQVNTIRGLMKEKDTHIASPENEDDL